MFTGIIEAVSSVTKKSNQGFSIKRPENFDDLKIGASIAVSGVCLTISALTDTELSFDVINTTLEKSTLKDLPKGSKVNLERAMPANGRFDGHIVQGHSETVAEVTDIVVIDGTTQVTIKLSSELLPFVVQHGSIALDGVSLTIANLSDDHVTVALVPHTLQSTTFGALAVGDFVNVETDILGKYARKA